MRRDRPVESSLAACKRQVSKLLSCSILPSPVIYIAFHSTSILPLGRGVVDFTA